jgi:hypothetical protein
MSLSPDRVCHTARGSLLLFACALLMALPASAQVYKWVDSKGVTHYDGSPPPPSASSSQTLAIPVAPAATETSSESWQEKDNAFKSRYDKRKADEAKQDEIDKKAQAAKETAPRFPADLRPHLSRRCEWQSRFRNRCTARTGFYQRQRSDRAELPRLGCAASGCDSNPGGNPSELDVCN